MAKGGRRRLRVAEGFGRAVYEGMVRRRTEDGLVWGIPDLAKATGAGLNTVRAWITRGVVPAGPMLAKLAEAINKTADNLLAAHKAGVYPIYMTGAVPKVAEPTAPAPTPTGLVQAAKSATDDSNQEAESRPDDDQLPPASGQGRGPA